MLRNGSTPCPRTGGWGKGSLVRGASRLRGITKNLWLFKKEARGAAGRNSPQTPFRPAIKSIILLKIGSYFVVKPYHQKTLRNFSEFFMGAGYG
ncbi:MAG: hypothetical protein COT26_01990 [Candidatus Kerfeldbacteria bacterium CG08_land_8_20_14_0_20_43_14]|uniref:Uncharacterized protein n=1 Tax=Candidatus Kerfeldbacteria bacterium CG08_land_8_20_14_0_20_43_14 TaxID=2014246 RepID=A0A2H0YSG2_9BACT|nr:MAG: hypothetical protein COT26_01990 [Candidatus Kerfeldbacteria bacterium CG08_land_8_20_14_0_20_43_14]